MVKLGEVRVSVEIRVAVRVSVEVRVAVRVSVVVRISVEVRVLSSHCYLIISCGIFSCTFSDIRITIILY